MSTSAYLIHGGDEYRVSEKTKEIINKLLSPEEQAFGLETIDGGVKTIAEATSAIDKCVEAISTGGLFGGKKVVLFRDISFLTDTPAGKSDAVKERLESLTTVLKAGLPAGQSLIMTSPKADKRFTFYTSCKNICEIHEFAVSEKSYEAERDARATLAQLLARTEIKMSEDAMETFIDKVGTDTRHIANELEKLGVYMGKRRNVEISDIEAITSSSRESRAWDLADAFGKRDLAHCIQILRRLIFQGEEPVLIFAVIEGRIRDLIIYRKALDAGWITMGKGASTAKWQALPEAQKMFAEDFEKDPTKTHPFRAGLLTAQAKLFSARKLAQCRKAIVEGREKMVSSSVSPEMVLELLIIQMLS